MYYRGLIGGPAARWGGVPKVAPEPSPYMMLRAVWLVALRLDGVVFQNVAPEPLPCILLEPLLCLGDSVGVRRAPTCFVPELRGETGPHMFCPRTAILNTTVAIEIHSACLHLHLHVC